jgi:hypothetical protein
MKETKSKGIRIKTIANMTEFLNYLSGASWTSQQINIMSRDKSIRSNLLSYATQLNFCKKEGNLYYFTDRIFDPFHAKQLIELSNKYNVEVVEKKRLRLEEEKNKQQNIVESNIKENYSELEYKFNQLEIEIENLFIENSSLKKHIVSANAEIEELRKNNKSQSYETEINLLKNKIVNFEKLLSAYFK